MKIAVTYENGQIFQHFGHSEQFKIYEIQENKILHSEIVGTEGNGHGALAGYLKTLGVEVLICGGIGAGAKQALGEANIQLYPGASGEADQAVLEYLEGNLSYNPNTECNHHHDEEGHHNCGEHSCSH